MKTVIHLNLNDLQNLHACTLAKEFFKKLGRTTFEWTPIMQWFLMSSDNVELRNYLSWLVDQNIVPFLGMDLARDGERKTPNILYPFIQGSFLMGLWPLYK